MPITIQASEGLFGPDAEAELFAHVMGSLLRISNAEGNSFFAPNLIGDGVTIPAGRSYAGGVRDDYVAIGLKLPTVLLADPKDRQQFVTEATDAVERAVEGRLPRNRIFVNLVYGDDFWGIGGTLYTAEDLKEATTSAAQADAVRYPAADYSD